MEFGTLYGIGVGPGDPELITLKAANILSSCRHVFVPKARIAVDSMSLAIAKQHLKPDAEVHEIPFPMTTDKGTLARRWDEAAGQIAAVLETGQDACFLTLGDPLLFSTYIPLLRALRKGNPDVDVITVPGITAFSAAAALTEFPVGKAKDPVTIVPATDDLNGVRRALAVGGTVVIMKIGKRLPQIMSLLEEAGLFDRAVFVARAGQTGQRVETDLGRLRKESPESGNLSIILVDTSEEATQ